MTDRDSGTPQILVQEAFDGLCTIAVGANLVITELTHEEAEHLADRFRLTRAA